ncbi:MAG: flagellar basal body L-ring protein FlgH [Deltaproteobacteria bacterium]|nr:flagellar basal body L-ring protein FlgH [Deltaproteobacteria bacterium]
MGYRGSEMKGYRLLSIIIPFALVAGFLAGCAGSGQRVKAQKTTVVSTKQVPYHGFFQDLRAFKVGDLVTINIVETSKATKKAATKTERSSSIKAGIDNLLGYETKMRSWGGLPRAFSNSTMFKASMANSFDGSGSTSRDETMTASITARVVEVLPNGNLFIRGTRQIKVNNEVQYITLSGLIRPYDISPDNTVLSTYIADAKIEYTGKGAVSDKQRPGWLMRLLDYVWPF